MKQPESELTTGIIIGTVIGHGRTCLLVYFLCFAVSNERAQAACLLQEDFAAGDAASSTDSVRLPSLSFSCAEGKCAFCSLCTENIKKLANRMGVFTNPLCKPT